jgi:PTS system N-acetylglucosamine-specific IIC component
VRPSPEGLQVVLGPIADAVAMEMRAAAGSSMASPSVAAAQAPPVSSVDAAPWVEALGGPDNIAEAGAAASRVWIRVNQADRLDEAALKSFGVRLIARPSPSTVHLLVGGAPSIAAALQAA